jgi:hypothetical protein
VIAVVRALPVVYSLRVPFRPTHLGVRVKILRHFAGAAAGVVLGVSVVGAQSIQFKGSTEGCFLSKSINYPDCNNTSTFGFDQSVVFFGGAFNQFTTNGNSGSVTIGDAAHPTSNFGYFSLGGLPSSYTGDIFKLAIAFDDPTNVTPGAVFQAVMYGAVDWRGDGSLKIDFGGPQLFNFNGPVYSGTFTLAINDVVLDPATLSDPYETITGNINTNITSGGVTATPEPATTALLATGLISLIPLARRRGKRVSPA